MPLALGAEIDTTRVSVLYYSCMDEAQALAISEQWMADRRSRAAEIRRQSEQRVLVQSSLLERALKLLHAAPKVGIKAPTLDPSDRAILALTSAQVELLEAGWEALLNGYYAAVAVPMRLISELPDYIAAAGLDEKFAERLMKDDKLQPADARKAVIRNEKSFCAEPQAADAWAQDRRNAIEPFNGSAHPRALLMTMTVHLRGDALHVGHDFDPVTLWALANDYTQLAVDATVGVGVALSESLTDGNPWSDEQASLLRDWRDFQRAGSGKPPEVDEYRSELARLRSVYGPTPETS